MLKDWLTEYHNWNYFMNSEEREDDLNRILVQLGGCYFGIGKPGVYKMSYGFASQVKVYFIVFVGTFHTWCPQKNNV